MKKLILIFLITPFVSWGQYSDVYLASEADTIRLETVTAHNTAKRVGRMFKSVISSKLSLNDGGTLLNTLFIIKSSVIGLNISGGNTSSSVTDVVLRRTGTASFTAGHGESIGFINDTSGKSVLLQGNDDNLSIYNNNGFGSTERLRVDASGLLSIADGIDYTSKGNMGDPGGPFTTQIGNIASKFTTSDNTTFHVTHVSEGEQTAATTFSIQGIEGITTVSHPSGTVTGAYSLIGNFFLNSTGTVTLVRSLIGGGNTRKAGTVTEWDILYAGFSNSGGATITNGYGVYIDTFPSGVTNKFGVFVADTSCKNILHGKLNLADLPTSSSGLASGDIWVNSNVLTRVP